MPDIEENNPLNSEEIKTKLRQIRADYTRARNILSELETYYASFDEVRKRLDDEDDGLEKNLSWSQHKKSQMDEIVTAANAKVTELEEASTAIKESVDEIGSQESNFTLLAAKINDPGTGIDAILTSATNLKNKIASLLEAARADVQSASAELADIQAKSSEVEEAYEEFNELMEKANDPETGVAAQVAEIEQYSKDALKAKTSAESELISVVSLKKNVTEHLEVVKTSRQEIEDYNKESHSLTDDIRNTLGLTSAYSLSKAIEDQRKRLDRSLRFWGWAVAMVVLMLVCALGGIFYVLFINHSTASVVQSGNGTNVLFTVLSKALFTSPFVFALYFTTSNFSRTRDFRDRYLAKEIAGKNLQAYTKLLRDEFPDKEQERLDFALHNMQAIYDDPVTRTKKRSYNIGVNKIFQIDFEEETEQVKDKVIDTLEAVAGKKNTEKTQLP